MTCGEVGGGIGWPASNACTSRSSMERIRTTAGVNDVRLHDLRRTVGSWMSQSKVDLNTIKEALRHSSIATTLTYARLGADPAREAIEEHGRRILAAAGKEESAEVAKLKR